MGGNLLLTFLSASNVRMDGSLVFLNAARRAAGSALPSTAAQVVPMDGYERPIVCHVVFCYYYFAMCVQFA